MLVWLMVSGVQAGGFVLGLLLLFVLAGPLAGAGWYVLVSGHTERVEEQAFVIKHGSSMQIVCSAPSCAQLRQLAHMPGLPPSSPCA